MVMTGGCPWLCPRTAGNGEYPVHRVPTSSLINHVVLKLFRAPLHRGRCLGTESEKAARGMARTWTQAVLALQPEALTLQDTTTPPLPAIALISAGHSRNVDLAFPGTCTNEFHLLPLGPLHYLEDEQAP